MASKWLANSVRWFIVGFTTLCQCKGHATFGIDMFPLTLMDVEWVCHVEHRFGIACRNPKKPTRSLHELSLNWDKHDIISTDCMGEVLEGLHPHTVDQQTIKIHADNLGEVGVDL